MSWLQLISSQGLQTRLSVSQMWLGLSQVSLFFHVGISDNTLPALLVFSPLCLAKVAKVGTRRWVSWRWAERRQGWRLYASRRPHLEVVAKGKWYRTSMRFWILLDAYKKGYCEHLVHFGCGLTYVVQGNMLSRLQHYRRPFWFGVVLRYCE